MTECGNGVAERRVALKDWLGRPAASASDDWFRIRLPATSANLGPGFDALGLALSIALTVDARRAGTFSLRPSGRDAAVTGVLEGNLILTTYSEILGGRGRTIAPLEILLSNEIPLGMGCGSSAAAICCGVLLANHFGELGWDLEGVLHEAARREGHPDNVAACLLGGLTASKTIAADAASEISARTVAATLGAELPWRLLLVLPRASLSTSKARKLLPDTYSREAAISNVQSTALLLGAFALNRPDLLLPGSVDQMHQPYRLEVCPLLGVLLPLAGRDGIYSVTLSGAGPSVLLIVSEEVPRRRVEAAGGTLVAEVLELSIGVGASVLFDR